jgi:hypothetical protein
MTKKEPKNFMESNVLHHKQHKLKTRHNLGDNRVHYGSGFMSDYHSSIKKAKKRLTNRDKLHSMKGGSINETRVY